MRRLALVTLVTMLALPGAALGRTFPGRVVHATANSLTLRLPGGKVVHYDHPRVAGPPAGQPLLAHAARATAAGVTLELRALEPGVTVLVTRTAAGVSIALPGPGAPEQHATGVVTAVAPDAYALRLADHTQLRLHGAGVHPCQVARVAYHQDAGLLVADGVRSVRGRDARGCAARAVQGTITAISADGLTIRTPSGRSKTFKAAAEGFAVGDVVDVTGHQVAYAQRLARGTVAASGDGTVTIISAAGGARETFDTAATPPVGDRVVIVYHRTAALPVADALYALAG
jgi:hypothetical protein